MLHVYIYDIIMLWKVPMTGWQPPVFMTIGSMEYIWEEVALMTAYETVSILIGILALLISFGCLIIALLAFLDKRKNKKR